MNDEDKDLEKIADQWVNLMFAHIESKKQQKNNDSSNNENLNIKKQNINS